MYRNLHCCLKQCEENARMNLSQSLNIGLVCFFWAVQLWHESLWVQRVLQAPGGSYFGSEVMQLEGRCVFKKLLSVSMASMSYQWLFLRTIVILLFPSKEINKIISEVWEFQVLWFAMNQSKIKLVKKGTLYTIHGRCISYAFRYKTTNNERTFALLQKVL